MQHLLEFSEFLNESFIIPNWKDKYDPATTIIDLIGDDALALVDVMRKDFNVWIGVVQNWNLNYVRSEASEPVSISESDYQDLFDRYRRESNSEQKELCSLVSRLPNLKAIKEPPSRNPRIAAKDLGIDKQLAQILIDYVYGDHNPRWETI